MVLSHFGSGIYNYVLINIFYVLFFSVKNKTSRTYSAYSTPSSKVPKPNKQGTKRSSSVHLQIKRKRPGHTTRAKAYKKDEYV